MQRAVVEGRGFFESLVGDGRPLLSFTGIALILSGAFALFQSATGHFLPHDVDFLGMTASDLCNRNQCRIVHFMFHDRVSFGGALIALGSLYLWLAEFPLRAGEPWAWWLFLLSGLVGFGSFLAYLGYHYLDKWHAVATIGLLPCYGYGMSRSFGILQRPASWQTLFRPAVRIPLRTSYGMGRACLLMTSCALIAAGITILTVGSTTVFVPQDLAYMNLSREELNAINPRLIPLIAHDRAGFGGGLCCTGITVFFCVWCGRPCRSLWQVLAVAGTSGFATAIGIHPLVGYLSLSHLAPAIVGSLLFLIGLVLCFRPMRSHVPGISIDVRIQERRDE
jgi:hypothetical protein